MRDIVRPAVRVLSFACLAASLAAFSGGAAQAQQQQRQAPPAQAAPQQQQQEPPVKQIALTEAQVQNVLTATKEMEPVFDKMPDDGKPDPKSDAQLESISKKNGFSSYADYNLVVDNINLVLGGFDTNTKRYVGAEAVIKAQMAEVQADKKMSAKEKKETLADLEDALKTPAPAIQNKGNIDLVAKYYDKLSEALNDNSEE